VVAAVAVAAVSDKLYVGPGCPDVLVHPADVPLTQAIKSVTRWGSGSKELVAAMNTERTFHDRLRGSDR
jgi:hypothetical protein